MAIIPIRLMPGMAAALLAGTLATAMPATGTAAKSALGGGVSDTVDPLEPLSAVTMAAAPIPTARLKARRAPPAIPEPTVLIVLGGVLLGLGILNMRKRAARNTGRLPSMRFR